MAAKYDNYDQWLRDGESQSLEFKTSFDKTTVEFDGSPQRKERFAYPLPAIREALLYGGLKLAELNSDNYRSSLRNKLVAEGFYLTGSIEKYGSGFIRIRKTLRDYPEIDFEIKEFAGGVMVTFAQRGGVNEGVNEGVNSLLKTIKLHPGLRVPALAERMATSAKNVERWLKQLKENGLVEFRGAAKTGGYYYLDSDE